MELVGCRGEGSSFGGCRNISEVHLLSAPSMTCSLTQSSRMFNITCVTNKEKLILADLTQVSHQMNTYTTKSTFQLLIFIF